MKIFIIIPAYNESLRIEEVLVRLVPLRHHIILVDDGSTDDTLNRAAAFPVTLLRHELNLGQGAALETAMELARSLDADFVIHFDADGQHDPADIRDLLAPLQDGRADIVFGSRFMGKKAVGLSPIRRLILRTARWMNFFMSGILLTDAHNGLRAMNRKALHAIHLRQPGMAHASEILLETRKNLLRYLEVPVYIRYTEDSKQKGQGGWNAINIFFHLLIKRK